MSKIKRIVALVDGEHYPPVIKSALKKIEEENPDDEIVSLIFVGGIEKIASSYPEELAGYPVKITSNLSSDLMELLEALDADVAIDLSDEPVLGYSERMQIASSCLRQGVLYRGADFYFEPIRFEDVSKKPSISIVGTGKRVGKTAVSAYTARAYKNLGIRVCVVAMGRGGPQEPQLVEGDLVSIDGEYLLRLSRSGLHASSDYLEDALVSRVKTVGCWRCGGGMAGAPFVSNVVDGVRLADKQDVDFLIFEGSGSCIPPVRSRATMCVISALQNPQYVLGYLGPYRLLISDAVVVTMCEDEIISRKDLSDLCHGIKKVSSSLKITHTIFRPAPLEPISGKSIVYVTTAVPSANRVLAEYLEVNYGCKVIFISNNLSNRPRLKEDLLHSIMDCDLILTELKAAAVDVVTEEAVANGKEVVYCDNIPVSISGDVDMDGLVHYLHDLALSRA
ncbi:MAG: 2,3-diphosphoglycerate synthetase [Actinobacteria bacterium]|nr:2,3-diphosphoglycerate synthetase [Actinomycetota bacterium]